MMKPHLQIIAGRPVEMDPRRRAVDEARRRFGQPFAFEPGSRWKPRETPLLTEWMATRTRGRE